MAEGCGSAGRLERVPDARTDVTTHSMSVMEAGGVTLVSEVPKVTHQVLAGMVGLAARSHMEPFVGLESPPLSALRI